MALSDAKSIPIDNAVAALETMVLALKSYRKKVILYSELESDRAELSKLAIEMYAKIMRGGTPVQVDIGDVVRAAMASVPHAPARRSVEMSGSDLKKMQDGTLVRDGALTKAAGSAGPSKGYADAQKQIIYDRDDAYAKIREEKAKYDAYAASKLRSDYSYSR